MTITLTAEQEEFVAEQLRNGNFNSADDVVAQCLGMLRAQEDFIRTNATELREKIAVGVEQVRRGEVVDGQKAIEKLREQLLRRQRAGG